MLGGTPQRGGSKGQLFVKKTGGSHSRARQFSKVRLSEVLSDAETRCSGYNLPRGAPERIKRGKEKVVTRAVAHAEMVS